MNDIFGLLLSQLGIRTPLLLAYFAGVVVALVWWRRCPVPGALTLASMAILLLSTIGHLFVMIVLLRVSNVQQWMLWANAFVANCAHAVAFCLVLTAVFMGRKTNDAIKIPADG